jgi:hypothetical protein
LAKKAKNIKVQKCKRTDKFHLLPNKLLPACSTFALFPLSYVKHFRSNSVLQLTNLILAMTLDEVMLKLEKMGSEQSKKVLIKHGAHEPFYGVKVEDMKERDCEKGQKRSHAFHFNSMIRVIPMRCILQGLFPNHKK